MIDLALTVMKVLYLQKYFSYFRMIFYLRDIYLELTDTGTQFAKWTDMMPAATLVPPITKWADQPLPTSHYKFSVSIK